MLLLCLTGLPLIFHHEIDRLLGDTVAAPALPADAPRISLDRVVAIADAQFPGYRPMFVSQDVDDDRIWYVTMSRSLASEADLKQAAIDARTGAVLAQPRLQGGFLNFMLHLHTDLFAGLPGKLFLGCMGLLLALAIVSGVILYAPFMRKLEFGTVRRGKASRLRWLDLHNLLGIVTLVWALVVALTGVINTLADPIIALWQHDQVQELIAPYRGLPPARPGSLQRAVDAAHAAAPGKALKFVAFPGTAFSTPHHYAVFMRGATPATVRLLTPVLVDAQTAAVTASRAMPWYVTALLISQPLHFGDYGGMAMKIWWALLDVATIVVLLTGLFLWFGRRRRAAARQETHGLPVRSAPHLAREGNG